MHRRGLPRIPALRPPVRSGIQPLRRRNHLRRVHEMLPRPIGRLGHGRRGCGGPVPAAGGQGSIHRWVPRARRPGTPRLRRSRHRETPVHLRILLQRGHGKALRRRYVVSFQPLRKTGVPRERALVEGHEACPGAHRGQGTEMLPGDPEGIQRRPLRASRLRGGGEGHGTGFGHPPFCHGLGKRKTATPERSRMHGLFGFMQKYASATLQTRHDPDVPAIQNGYIGVRGP